jgi:hypothetical protein
MVQQLRGIGDLILLPRAYRPRQRVSKVTVRRHVLLSNGQNRGDVPGNESYAGVLICGTLN